MILDLVPSTNPILKQVCEPFNFESPQCDPDKLARDLKDTMIAKGGIGLSASQVGLPYRVFVAGDPKDPDNIHAFFNPKIVDITGDMVLMEEGCLSYPGLFVKIKRRESVRVRYADPRGEVTTEVFDEIPSRVIQHEYDHLDGIVYFTHANRYHLDAAKRQKKKLDKRRKSNYNIINKR